MKIELGVTVQDKITGFRGIVTGRVEYISGCNQLLVTGKVGPDGVPKDPQWFDEQRCEAQSDPRVMLDNTASPGFDKAAPKR